MNPDYKPRRTQNHGDTIKVCLVNESQDTLLEFRTCFFGNDIPASPLTHAGARRRVHIVCLRSTLILNKHQQHQDLYRKKCRHKPQKTLIPRSGFLDAVSMIPEKSATTPASNVFPARMRKMMIAPTANCSSCARWESPSLDWRPAQTTNRGKQLSQHPWQ